MREYVCKKDDWQDNRFVTRQKSTCRWYIIELRRMEKYPRKVFRLVSVWRKEGVSSDPHSPVTVTRTPSIQNSHMTTVCSPPSPHAFPQSRSPSSSPSSVTFLLSRPSPRLSASLLLSYKERTLNA